MEIAKRISNAGGLLMPLESAAWHCSNNCHVEDKSFSNAACNIFCHARPQPCNRMVTQGSHTFTRRCWRATRGMPTLKLERVTKVVHLERRNRAQCNTGKKNALERRFLFPSLFFSRGGEGGGGAEQDELASPLHCTVRRLLTFFSPLEPAAVEGVYSTWLKFLRRAFSLPLDTSGPGR